MDPTFDTPGDAMKPGWFGSVRTKYIHSVGVVGKVKFVAKPNPYTGIFKGANNGLIRLSSAAKPGDGSPLTPGFGLKFLRDGKDSANLVAMYGVNGTPDDWNFFSKDFKNHIAPADGAALKAVAFKFSYATDWIQSVGLSDMAKYDEAGNETSDPKAFPFELRFEPHEDVHYLFPTALPDGDAMDYISQLESVRADLTLYNVYALDKPTPIGGTETLIGTIQLDGQMVKSKWGDEKLFFRHQRTDEDVKLRPEWDPYYARYSLDGKCPYQKLL